MIYALTFVYTAALFWSVHLRIENMNQQEIEAFDALSKKIDSSIAAHKETNEALATSQAALATANAKVAELEAQLAAVPPPAADDSADVLAAVKADEDKLDADHN